MKNIFLYIFQVSIVYNPGKFPQFKGNQSVNGGIPQEANLGAHVRGFIDRVEKYMPKNFSGRYC